MAKKFSNVCLIPCNGMLLVQNALRPIRRESERAGGTYPVVSVEILLF